MRIRLFFGRFLVLPLAVFLLGTVACAPARPPIPPGEVPKPKVLTITDEQYGHKVLQELSDRYELDYNHPRSSEVQKVVERLTEAAGAGTQPWHVYVFKDTSVKNAAATRGNHVFIWTGLLDATKNESELATILAHEISHVLAGHTDPDPNEEVKRLLIGLGAAAAGIAVSVATNSSYGADLGRLASAATEQFGSTLFVYPYSREREYEADQVGLFLMAKAHYPPQSAVEFWSRARGDPDLSGQFGFLSTHPPAAERLDRLKVLLPQAEAVFGGMPITKVVDVAAQPAAGGQVLSGSSSGRPGSSSSLGAVIPQAGSNPHPMPAPAGSPKLPAGNDDSFAVSGRETPLQAPGQASLNGWSVKSAKAILYDAPEKGAKALGELKKGAKVNVLENRKGFLYIEAPEPGYLRASDMRLD